MPAYMAKLMNVAEQVFAIQENDSRRKTITRWARRSGVHGYQSLPPFIGGNTL